MLDKTTRPGRKARFEVVLTMAKHAPWGPIEMGPPVAQANVGGPLPGGLVPQRLQRLAARR